MRVVRLCALVGLVSLAPTGVGAQEQRSPYADAQAQRLVEGARRQLEETLREGRVRAVMGTRMRAGLLIPNQWNWRSRTLYHKETLGLADFAPDRAGVEQVLARTRGSPIVGDHLIDRDALWGKFGFDPEDSRPAFFGLVGISLGGIGSDVLSGRSLGTYEVFDTSFVDPLGPKGPAAYRYTSGQTMAPAGEDSNALLAVAFQPVDSGAGGTKGIIWFDATSGDPVLAMIRPLGRWTLDAGLRGFIRKVPLVPKNATGAIDFIAVDYTQGEDGRIEKGLVRLQGSMYWFWDQAIMPVHMDWNLDWNANPPAEPVAPEPMQGGWSPSAGQRALQPFVRATDSLVGPAPTPRVGRVAAQAASSARFNQVQGVNFKVKYPVPLDARTTIDMELGIPTSSFQLTGSIGLRRELYPVSWGAESYARLKDANWQEIVNGAMSSITALLTGYDDGNYYLAKGGGVWVAFDDHPVKGSLTLFAEHQEEAPKTATYSLFDPDTTLGPPPNIDVTKGYFYGVRARGEVQVGEDPQRGVLLARLYGQAVTGKTRFVSIGTTTDLVGPLPGPFTGGFRVQAGLAGGEVPGQALFYLGGYKTIRGYPPHIAYGPSMLVLSAEIGTDVPLARLVAFTDVGWAGEFDTLLDRAALTAVGGGISIGDGILRLELAKGLQDGGVWRFQILTSGLF